MRKHKSRNGRGWHHAQRIAELDSCEFLGLDEIPECALLGVVWLGRVTGGRPNTIVLDLQQVSLVEGFSLRVAPQLETDLTMQIFSKGLDESVRKSLCHDLGEVVILSFVPFHQSIAAETGYRKEADMVLVPLRRDEVGLGHVWVVRLLFRLLTKHAKFGCRFSLLSIFFRQEHVNVLSIFTSIGGIQPNNSLQGHGTIGDDILHHGLSVIEELLRFASHRCVVEDLRVTTVWVSSTEFPCLEEWVPIDVRHDIGNLHRVDNRDSWLGGGRSWRGIVEINFELALLCLLEGQEVAILQPCVVVLSHFFIFLIEVIDKVGLVFTQQRRYDRHGSRRIQNVNHRVFRSEVVRRDLDGSVHLGCCSSSD
mmetsp:Transcript_546/g.1303  ORF Transcript_546/g.1303 Transcript_546/m.1303 type:complete len:366 (+) Transcript_546:330-1427(+)